MEKIKELIVVEGKHDKQKLEKLFECDVVCTNGLSLDPSTINIASFLSVLSFKSNVELDNILLKFSLVEIKLNFVLNVEIIPPFVSVGASNICDK